MEIVDSLFVECLWWAVLEGIEDKTLEEFLIRDSHLHGMTGWTMLPVPRLHQGHILGTPTSTRAKVERSRGPE